MQNLTKNSTINFFRKIFLMGLLLIAFWSTNTNAQNNIINFTQEDRDRGIRTETKLDERFNTLQKQLDENKTTLQKQLDDSRADSKWQFGILISAFFILFGFIMWDRRTYLKPVQSQISEIDKIIVDEKLKSGKCLPLCANLQNKTANWHKYSNNLIFYKNN